MKKKQHIGGMLGLMMMEKRNGLNFHPNRSYNYRSEHSRRH